MPSTLQILDAQLQKFTLESIHSFEIGQFDFLKFKNKLSTLSGKQIIGIDLGGDKISATTFVVKNGQLEKIKETEILESDGGRGYLEFLEKQAELARKYSVLVGISHKGFLKGTRLVEAPILGEFIDEFEKKYNLDYSKLFDQVVVVNDGEAALLGATVHSLRDKPDLKNVMLVINGSGLGLALYNGGKIYRTEAGHVELVSELNKMSQDRKCGMFGQDFVCIENVAAGKAGVEYLWNKKTGEKLTGKELAVKLMEKDPMAVELFTDSAQVVGYMILGVIKCFELESEMSETMFVSHGGTFHIESYLEMVKETMESYLKTPVNWLVGKNLSDNISLEGAVVAALVKKI